MPTPKIHSVLALIAALSGVLLGGCYQVPVTGRKALNMTSDKDVTKMSVAAFEDLKSRHPKSRDRARIDQLQRIGDRLARVVFWDMPDAEWEFVVFDVNQINAFAMAGGKVGVFTGLFKIANTDDEIASVIAHEIAHVTAKHVHERLSQEMLANAGGMVSAIGLSTSGVGALASPVVLGLYGQGVGAQIMAYDREKEKEADYIGLMYAAKAGFNPEASVRVLERLESETAPKVPLTESLTSTHPPTPDRIAKLTEAMPKALELYEKSALKPKPTVLK